MKLFVLAAALLLALASAPAPAGRDAPPAVAETAGLEWLAGRWQGEGQRRGETVETRLEARFVLGGRFLELSFASGGFEGRAFYRPSGAGRWQGQWFDSRGVTMPLAAAAGGRSLTAEWGGEGTERGRTVYRLRADGRLEIGDSVAGADGRYRPFASHLLQRAE